jgi:hypothetical protein
MPKNFSQLAGIIGSSLGNVSDHRETLRAQSKGFLVKNYSGFYELHVSALK